MIAFKIKKKSRMKGIRKFNICMCEIIQIKFSLQIKEENQIILTITFFIDENKNTKLAGIQQGYKGIRQWPIN